MKTPLLIALASTLLLSGCFVPVATDHRDRRPGQGQGDRDDRRDHDDRWDCDDRRDGNGRRDGDDRRDCDDHRDHR